MVESKYSKLQEACRDLNPVGAIIESEDCIYILFEGKTDFKFDDGYIGAVANYYPKIEGVWSLSRFGGYKGLHGAVSGDGRLVVCSADASVLGQPKEYDNTTEPEFLFEFPVTHVRINVTNVRSIAGCVYIVTKGQGVYKRMGVDESWKTSLKNKPIKAIGKYGGFTDIDGFSVEDMYACGGRGVLWHFNGVDWQEVELETCLSELYFQTLCCAPDGSVYIGCRKGEIISKKDGAWTTLDKKAPGEILDIISYKDKIYLACGKKGLLVYDGLSISVIDELESANNLSTDGDILVVTGNSKVNTFDDSNWKLLYEPYSLT